MAETKHLPSRQLHERTSFLLSQLGFHSDGRFNELLAPLGVNARQYGVLRILADTGWQSQQQLSAALHLHRNVMVGMVDELQRRGLVERLPHPSDRRANAVHLTGTARRLLPRIEAILDACDNELLAALDPAERTLLRGMLQRVAGSAALIPDVHPGYGTLGPTA